eukprot:GHVU01061789.1.p2 GENE.GHVU01061789.1~~GHVU01061789.1.p2  ORF type:complete len:124 (+),score=9.07 GHVU01061789.1:3-374(+)
MEPQGGGTPKCRSEGSGGIGSECELCGGSTPWSGIEWLFHSTKTNQRMRVACVCVAVAAASGTSVSPFFHPSAHTADLGHTQPSARHRAAPTMQAQWTNRAQSSPRQTDLQRLSCSSGRSVTD